MGCLIEAVCLWAALYHLIVTGNLEIALACLAVSCLGQIASELQRIKIKMK